MTIFIDAATISGTSSVSIADVRASVDSNTITSRSTVISDDRGPFGDSATPKSITTPAVPIELQTSTKITISGTPEVGRVLSATIFVNVPTATASPDTNVVVSGGGFAGTGTTVGGETNTSYVTSQGFWGSFDDDNGIIT